MRCHAYDHRGPCINLRTVTLCETIDPLGIGEPVNWEVERDIFDAVEFQAQSFVMSGDEVLREGPDLHDYAGLGSCLHHAIGDAEELRSKIGDKVDTIVIAKLMMRPALFSKEKAFYANSVKVVYALPRWGSRWVKGQHERVSNLNGITSKFTIWRNGLKTDQWELAKRVAAEWPLRDVAGDRRTQSLQ